MKKTFLVKPGCFWPLARHLTEKYGTPTVREILTIYVDQDISDEYLKIVLDSSNLSWSWFDRIDFQNGLTGGDGRRPYKTTKTDLSNLKSKLVFLAKKFGKIGQMSATVSYKFVDDETKFSFDLRPDTLVGEIGSIEGPVRPIRDHHDPEKMKLFECEIMDHVTQEGLNQSISNNRNTKEYVISVGDNWRLSPEITDFCNRNGIVNAFHSNPNKKQLIERRDNNYTSVERFFDGITGTALLSAEDHYFGNLPFDEGVSIIIPFFNSKDSIRKVLLAIQSQDIDEEQRRNIEVIIVDDASDENPADFLNSSEFDFDLKIISLTRNSGAAHARELGVLHSNGEILIFLDSDILLSKDYIRDHVIRNKVITNGVFVSFKQDVDRNSPSISEGNIVDGLPVGDYSNESRTRRTYPVQMANSEETFDQEVNMLEETFYFKNFHGSQKLGMFSVAGMIVGHNFSVRKDFVERARPFSRRFKGWGMEDYYTGIQVLLAGGYIIPVLSSAVFHLDHPPRSGSNERKSEEAHRNLKIIDDILEEPANQL